jgi:hypothetical protein
VLYLHSQQVRATSSVGSEHLVYTQGVRGSNPLSPTKKSETYVSDFLFYITFNIRSNAIPLDPFISMIFLVGLFLDI